jgi:hypothetical protein
VAFRQLAYLPDRRSTRIEQSVHVTVRGLDASRAPYQEKISTLSVSCHGCRYLSRNEVLLGDIATVEVVQPIPGRPKGSAAVRVRSVRRLGANEKLFDVAVELESPQDIWSLTSPPQDWSEFSKPATPVESTRELRIVPRPEAPRTPAPRRITAEPFRLSDALTSGAAAPLPPLLAQLAAGLREQTASSPGEARRAATDSEARRESVDQLCSQIECKAMEILESLARACVEGLSSRTNHVSEARHTREALRRIPKADWLERFDQEIAKALRRPVR